MAKSQPFTVACNGGLIKSVNSIDLLKTPGAAKILENFEVSVEGGYRRINGYAKFGTTSATKPTGSTTNILGVFPYADGVVACAATGIYFSQDGITWVEITRSSVDANGDNYTAFTGRSTLTRTNQGQCQFALFEGAAYDYGQLLISDGANKPYYFRMEGTGALASRTYFASEVTVNSTKGVKYVTIHDKHLIAAGVEDNESTIYYSKLLDPTDFTGTGSGSVTISDQIVGIKSFRQDLFIFCENSIHKLQDINGTPSVVPVAENVGCLSGYSIQEIGGDIVFLAQDGIRTVAGTARIGDVELGTVSKNIQPIMVTIAQNIEDYIIDSVVIREKSQYRLYYSNAALGNTNTSLEQTQQKGIIGTLRPDGFQWSETVGLEVTSVNSNFDTDGVEVYYHGDTNGYVYTHDTGYEFDGSNINAKYQTSDYDYGDLGTLKTMHYVKLSIAPEAAVTPTLRVRYDYDTTDLPQPSDYSLDIPAPAIFGSTTFGSANFGAGEQPLTRVALQGSGHSNSFRISSDDKKASYIINGLYIDFIPSGRR